MGVVGLHREPRARLEGTFFLGTSLGTFGDPLGEPLGAPGGHVKYIPQQGLSDNLPGGHNQPKRRYCHHFSCVARVRGAIPTRTLGEVCASAGGGNHRNSPLTLQNHLLGSLWTPLETMLNTDPKKVKKIATSKAIICPNTNTVINFHMWPDLGSGLQRAPEARPAPALGG